MSSSFDEAVLRTLTPRGSRLLPVQELVSRILGPDPAPEAEEELRARVEELEKRGLLVRLRGGKVSRIEFTDFSSGRLAVRGEGRAWLLSGEPGVPDLPIVKGGLGGALDGDIVIVKVEKKKPRRGSRTPPELGLVTKVLKRKRDTVVGRLVRGPEGAHLLPFDTRIDARLQLVPGSGLDAPEGVFVEARIVSYPDERRFATCELLEVIGMPGDPGVDVEVVARKWGLPRVFPPGATAEAETADGTISPAEQASRRDFTREIVVTIDGETARDFDDAISARELPGGGFEVAVHIADVAHYVRPGSALDAEAFERGTSVYFPDRALPMLPERLSTDLCSLRPLETRRTVSALLTLDARGETAKAVFSRSLIRSRTRLTYTTVAELLDGKPAPSLGIDGETAGMLAVAARAALLLRERRVRRGSLDFDLPDADLILGETGDIVEIVKAVRNQAHRLIEEMMLAANEAVAKHLLFVPTPSIYRVHDAPDERKLAELKAVLEPLGYELDEEDEGGVSPQAFQSLLDQAAGRPEERFVSDLVLRAQKKALYSPECRGHYALAADHYAHFTSPIRRYPDLLVHRALVEWLEKKAPPPPEEAEGRGLWLVGASSHCSERERRAESAEREAQSWKKFVFLSRRVGEEFDSFVSGVTPFGLFVTLAEIYVDGLVPMSLLGDDFYRFEEGEHRLVGATTGRVHRLGDSLRVLLTHVDFDKRTLNFKPVGAPTGPRLQSRTKGTGRTAVRKPGRDTGRKAPRKRGGKR